MRPRAGEKFPWGRWVFPGVGNVGPIPKFEGLKSLGTPKKKAFIKEGKNAAQGNSQWAFRGGLAQRLPRKFLSYRLGAKICGENNF